MRRRAAALRADRQRALVRLLEAIAEPSERFALSGDEGLFRTAAEFLCDAVVDPDLEDPTACEEIAAEIMAADLWTEPPTARQIRALFDRPGDRALIAHLLA